MGKIKKDGVGKLNLTAEEMNGLYKRLYSYYGPQGWWPLRSKRIAYGAGFDDTIGFNTSGYHPGIVYKPVKDDIFEIAAGAVLTQNTNWKNAAAAIDNLIKNDLLNTRKILESDIEELALIIKTSGYYNQKAIKLKNVAELIESKNGSAVSRQELLAVWGIGPETADSIMLYAYHRPFFVIDAFTRRILSRYTGEGFIQKAGYEILRTCIEGVIPADINKWQEMHALFVIHAKKFCTTKPECGACPLFRACKKIK